ncbi:MAG: GreA/GreB family elongation factor [Myxococcales bacterium]|nr:GreA/GreB family elongation factor [Myxococcales bacterium]
MDKWKLLDAILLQLHENRDVLLRSAEAAFQAATHEESIAENKYDTRGLEASYLAAGQSKRLADVAQDIDIFTRMKPRDFGKEDAISLGALVEVMDEQEVRQWFFLAPRAGGFKLEYAQRNVSIITPRSPLGEQLMGAYAGDIIELRKRNKIVEYEILSVV